MSKCTSMFQMKQATPDSGLSALAIACTAES